MRSISELPQYTTVTCQTVSAGGEFYAACTEAGAVVVWTVRSILDDQSPAPVHTFTPYSGGPVYSLTSTDSFLITGGRGEVKGWEWRDLKNKITKPSWSIHIGSPARRVQINWMDTDKQEGSHDRLVVGCGDRVVYVYDLETRALTGRLTGHTQYVHCVAAADGSGGVAVISGGEDGAVRLWDTRKTNPEIYSFYPYKEAELSSPGSAKFISTVSTAGDWLVCGGGPSASLWNLSTRIMSSRLPPESGAVYAATMLDDRIAVGGQNTAVHVSNFGGETCAELAVNPSCVYSLVSDLNQDILVAAGASSTIQIFSVKSQTLIKSLHFTTS